MPSGEIAKHREMRGGRRLDRRNAHEAAHRQLQAIPALRNEAGGVPGSDARLLRFLAGIHLDETVGAPSGARHLCRQRFGKARPVDRLDDVEESDGIAHLVGLERADQMQHEIGTALAQRRKLVLRLLHPVLAEHSLTGGDRRLDGLGRVRLADRDQGHRLGRPAARSRRLLDAGPDSGEIAGDMLKRHARIEPPNATKTERTLGTMNILVYSGLELLGDGIMKLPFVRALRRTWPEARITWLAGKGRTVYSDTLAPLVRECLDEVIEDAGIGTEPSELLRRPLAGRRFDLLIDTQRRLLTTLILRRIRTRCFVSGAAGFLLSSRKPRLPYRKPPAMAQQLFDLIEIASGKRPEPDFALRLDERWQTEAQRRLPEGPVYVGIAPGAGGAHKRWPLDRFVALAQAQRDEGRIPVFLLGPDEAPWLTQLRQELPEALFPLQDDGGGDGESSPLLTIAIAQRLAAAVANDSGTGHLIAAAGCKMVSLFGPTRAAKFAPCAARLEIVDANAFGSPDMTAIPTEAVIAAVERLGLRARLR